jgi:hypothetical protein
MSLEFKKDAQMGKMFRAEQRDKLFYKISYLGEEEKKRIWLTENEGERKQETQTHLNILFINIMVGFVLYDFYFPIIITCIFLNTT